MGYRRHFLPPSDPSLLRQAARHARARKELGRRAFRGLRVRILILNWRDPRNPRAGGAEYLTYEIAERLVRDGDEVEWFSATFPGGSPREEMDAVRIVRAGGQSTVHWQAFRRYRSQIRSRFDVVIDEV